MIERHRTSSLLCHAKFHCCPAWHRIRSIAWAGPWGHNGPKVEGERALLPAWLGLTNPVGVQLRQRRMKCFIRDSPATFKCLGVTPYSCDTVLGAGQCLHVSGQSCGEEPVHISSQEVCVRHATSTRRLAMLFAVESNATLYEILMYFPEMEIEEQRRIKGFDGVDIIGLSSSGMPTCLFGMIITNILTQIFRTSMWTNCL